MEAALAREDDEFPMVGTGGVDAIGLLLTGGLVWFVREPMAARGEKAAKIFHDEVPMCRFAFSL